MKWRSGFCLLLLSTTVLLLGAYPVLGQDAKPSPSNTMDEILKIATLIVAVAALILSIINFSNNKKIQKLTLHVNWNKEIISWSSKFIDETGNVLFYLRN